MLFFSSFYFLSSCHFLGTFLRVEITPNNEIRKLKCMKVELCLAVLVLHSGFYENSVSLILHWC